MWSSKLELTILGLTVAWALSALADKTSSNCDVNVGETAQNALALTERALATMLGVVGVAVPFSKAVF